MGTLTKIKLMFTSLFSQEEDKYLQLLKVVVETLEKRIDDLMVRVKLLENKTNVSSDSSYYQTPQ